AVEGHGADLLCNQVEYHPYLSQEKVLEAVRRYGMMLTAYSPIARGKVLDEPAIRDIAERHGKSPAQIALRWLLDQEAVAAIPRTANEKHLRANFEIFDFSLKPEDRAAIDGLRGDGRMIEVEGYAPDWDPA
ncbi:MAG: 2,5-didehydrogluconate reductase DkgB, partial [Rhodospirillaceae bacterium]|nr:2,5-didehydrogluconate reductase DkgB [Rhodospirillaceae bacterium]